MRNILLFIFCCAFSITGYTQETSDFKKIEYGILVQANFGYLKVNPTNWVNLGIDEEINAIETQNRFGFGLGIMGKFNLSKYFSIVPQPSIYFQQNQLFFDLETINDHEEEIKPVALALPIHLVFTKQLWQNWNPSIALGARYVLGISDSDTPSPIDVQNHDFAIDFGVGVEVKLKNFKLKPELMISRGLMNLRKLDDALSFIDSTFDRIHQDQIAFRVLFYN